jgi:proteasome lid subunit RPN8/RPN11
LASWARVTFDTSQANQERARLFKEGWHCVGIWHTHPEPMPSPSPDDRQLAREHALAARGYLDGLVFAILGNGPLPQSLRVWIDDGTELRMTKQIANSPKPSRQA